MAPWSSLIRSGEGKESEKFDKMVLNGGSPVKRETRWVSTIRVQVHLDGTRKRVLTSRVRWGEESEPSTE